MMRATLSSLHRLVVGTLAAALIGVAPVAPAPAQEPAAAGPVAGGPVEVGLSVANDLFDLAVYSYELSDTKLGVAAPAGYRFMTVNGLIRNRSDQGMALPDAAKIWSIYLANYLYPLSEVSADTAMPLWGEVKLAAHEERLVEAVFVVPGQGLEGARLVQVGTSLGTLSVPLIEDPVAKARPTLAGPATAADLEVTVHGLTLGDRFGRYQAPDGWKFADVEMTVVNRQGAAPQDLTLSDFLLLVEDDAYQYPASVIAPAVAPMFAGPFRYIAALPVTGHLPFLVPADAGDLALTAIVGKERFSLDLTPDKAVPKSPAILAGPVESDRLHFELVGMESWTPPAGGAALLKLDLGLTLQVKDPTAVLPLDPRERLRLVDDAGQVYEPAPVWAALRRGFLPVELRSRRPIRGEVAFDLPPGVKPETLKVEFLDGDRPLSFRLPAPHAAPAVKVAAEPAPTAEAPAAPAVAAPAATAPPATEAAAAPRPGGDVVFIDDAVVPGGELVNVTANGQRVLYEGVHYSEKLGDGIVAFLQYAYTDFGKPITVNLLQGYPIEKLRFHLYGDKSNYGYLLEGSQDGAKWEVIADRRNDVYKGWQEFELYGRPYRAFRLTGVKTGKPGEPKSFYLSEFEAYTKAPVPTHMPDIALHSNGGRVVSVTSTHPRGYYGPEKLIDGVYATAWGGHVYPWRSAEAEGNEAPPPQDIVIGFHEDRAAPVLGMIFHPGGVPGWQELNENPKDIEVWASGESPTDGFVQLGSYTLDDIGHRVYLPFDRPVQARYFKVRLLTNHGGRVFSVGEIELLEAPRPGTEPFLDSFVIGKSPESALNADRNILDFRKGGRKVSVSDNVEWGPHQGLISGSPEYHYEVVFKSEPASVVLGFYDDREALVDQINLYPYTFSSWRGLPFKVRLDASRTGPDGPYEQVGGVYILTAEPGWHAIKIPPTRMRYLKVTVLSRHYGESGSGMSEVQAIEARAPGYHSVLDIDGLKDRTVGPDIALASLGGHIVSAPPDDIGGWTPERLIDGRVTDPGGWVSNSYGWSSKADAERPVTLTLAFNQNRLARIAGFGINPAQRTENHGGFDTAPYGNPSERPREVELWVSRDSPDGPWERVDRPRPLLQRPALHTFAFERPVEARYLQVRLTENFGGKRFQLGEIEIYEAPEVDGYVSILKDRPLNIADPALGGGLVRFSSAADAKMAGHLIDPGDRGPAWTAANDRLPQRFVVAFRDFHTALVDRVELEQGKDVKPENRPTAVKVSAATGTSPIGPWRTVGTFPLDPAETVSTLRFDQPVEARYLEVALLGTGGKPAVLDRLKVIEARKPGYVSVIAGGGRGPETAVEARSAELPADAAETEPNDQPEQGTPLPIGRTVRGAVDPQTDVDYFTLDLSGSDRSTVNLRLRGAPFVKSFMTLEGPDGKALFDYDPAESTDEETFSWQLQPDRYRLKLYEPSTSIVLLFDDSGSMQPSVEALKKAAIRYIQAKAPHEELALVKFSRRASVLQDFTKDTAALETAVEGQLAASGGTALYDGLNKALEMLKDRKGNRAIVLLSDGADSQSGLPYGELWNRVAAAGVRLYVVALGDALNIHYGPVAATPANMMRGWTFATGGRLFFAPTPAELMGLYERISAELRATPRYSLNASLPVGEGVLHVLETGERMASVTAPTQIELILDASGSMRGKTPDGETKMTAAKRVLHSVIDSLPAGARVGLRVYGHRQPREPKSRSCRDSQLVVPFAPVDRGALHTAVDGISPKGQTPIGLSLRLLEKDLGKSEGRKLVILITDGIETCADKPSDADYPPKVVQALLDKGLQIKVNVIGFDIGESATRAFLEKVAAASGGSYFSAGSSAELEAALNQAMQVPFTVSDALGNTLATGLVGTPVAVPEGRYRVEVASTDPIALDDVAVEPDRATRVFLNKEGDEVGLDVKVVAKDAPLPAGVGAPIEPAPAPVATLPPAAEPKAPAAKPAEGDTVATLLAEAEALFDQKKLTTPRGTSAFDRYSEVLARDPGNAAAKEGLSRIAAQYVAWADAALGRGDGGKAAGYFGKAATVEPDNAGHRVGLGKALLKDGKPDEAEAAFREALNLSPKLAAAEQGLRDVAAAREAAKAPAKPEVKVEIRRGVPEVLDTGNLLIQGKVVPLFGVIGADRPYTQQLDKYIAGRETLCVEVAGKRFLCMVGGRDIAELVLRSGAGRATPDATTKLKKAEAEARAARRGVWR